MFVNNVEIDEGSIIQSHVNISGYTKIGKNNTFYPFASIGSNPQDFGGASGNRIGMMHIETDTGDIYIWS